MANELNRIPAVLVDYAVYLGNSRLIGTGEVTLPSINAVTADLEGAGIGGKVELPVLGKFDSMTTSIAFRTLELAMSELMTPVAKDITVRASQQVYDGAGGNLSTEGLVVQMRVMPKATDHGSMKSGEAMDGKVELEVLRLRVSVGGRELYEIDKLNCIYRVNGVDYSASIRADLGI